MYRVGHGIDVHRFAEDRPLVLGGVRIADRGGLEGHSDADAVLHALTDAVLGAIGAGDIGEYFPSSDPRWRGASSRRFVEEAIRLVHERGGTICNVDLTIITERPRMATHKPAIRDAVASACGVSPDRVNVKATTTDGLGFTGRGEGLCATATVSIDMPGTVHDA
jgi:2-C-methyl-D-erythritol 4-phosphate cytidylyltransferase / 2-C-methyl-D-erythritol 2,4-cyclodiphosphate synthase